MDDPEGYKQSKARADAIQIGTSAVSTSVEPSPANSAKKARAKLSDDKGV